MFQENDQERDLYERAHQAAKEAEREGDAQLQAAVAPVAVYYPVSTPVRFTPWSLRFEDKRLEAVYWRLWSTGCEYRQSYSDVWSVTLELALSFLRLCFFIPKTPTPELLHLVHVSVATSCLALIIFQVLLANWYRSHRGTLLSLLVALLYSWEGLELLLDSSIKLSVLQSVLLSFVHRAPFRSHMTFRLFGVSCQLSATFLNGNTTSFHILLLLLAHTLGAALAYMLDRKARSSFLQALPTWLLDDQRCKLSQPSASTTTWNTSFYPELLEKPEEVRREQAERALVHRPLGGFAGGFGGVSGLKCTNLSPNSVPVVVAVTSSNSPGGGETSEASWSGSTRTEQEQEQVQDTASSASSQVRPSLRRRI